MGFAAHFSVLVLSIAAFTEAVNVDRKVNLLRRTAPLKKSLSVKIIASQKTYEDECEKGSLFPVMEPGHAGKVMEVDEAGEGSVLFHDGNGDEGWVPIRALVGYENWVKGCSDCGGPGGSPAPAPGGGGFAPAPAVDTSPTTFMYSGCMQAKEIKDELISPLGMSSAKCFTRCKKQGDAKYFGLTGGGMCYCTQLPPGSMVNPSKCDIKCSGNPKEKCGGINKLSSVYTMMDCTPPTDQEKKWLGMARDQKLMSLYGELEGQSCAQKKNNVATISGSSKMFGSPEKCKLACYDAPGSETCDGFTYSKLLSRCTFYKDVTEGRIKKKVGLACYFKKLGYPY
jgi:hypothetical protein